MKTVKIKLEEVRLRSLWSHVISNFLNVGEPLKLFIFLQTLREVFQQQQHLSLCLLWQNTASPGGEQVHHWVQTGSRLPLASVLAFLKVSSHDAFSKFRVSGYAEKQDFASLLNTSCLTFNKFLPELLLKLPGLVIRIAAPVQEHLLLY